MNGEKKDVNFSDLFADISNKEKNIAGDNKTFASILSSNQVKEDSSLKKISLNSLVNDVEEKDNGSSNKGTTFNAFVNEVSDGDIVEENDNGNNEIFSENVVSDVTKEEANNSFFDSVESNTGNSNESVSQEINNDVFLNDKKDVSEEGSNISKEENDNKDSTNLFFDSVESNTGNSNESVSQEINNDVFLNDKKDVSAEESNISKEENDNKGSTNLFFDSVESNTGNSNENVSQEINNDVFLNDKKDANNNFTSNENISDITKNVDSSPFFSSEDIQSSKSDINPFFDNKLNLDQSKNFDNSKKIDTSATKHFNVKIVKKKEPLVKFILGVLSYAIFIWLLLIGITLLVYVADIKIRAMKGDYTPPKYNAYVVLTGSMLPEIKVYDVVVTKKVEPKELKEGDIITFASSDTRFEGTIITHRIINTYYDANSGVYTFQTKGDNNNVPDSALVQSSNIYGKVILKIPKLGYLQEFLASRGGWIIVILIPCLVVISYDITRLVKSIRAKKHRKLKVTS